MRFMRVYLALGRNMIGSGRFVCSVGDLYVLNCFVFRSMTALIVWRKVVMIKVIRCVYF